MTPEQLAAIEARAKAATEGPWYLRTNRHPDTRGRKWGWISIYPPLSNSQDGVPGVRGEWTESTPSQKNLAFIAHARTDIPTLLAAYRSKEAECARLREALRDARDMVADWAAYASEYYQKKWRLDEDLAKIDAALEAKP